MTLLEVPPLSCTPIGFMRTDKRVKFDAPHQPDMRRQEENVIELLPGYEYEKALRDLDGFSHIWLVWWFHRNTTWRPLVLPPRGAPKRRGMFATRSPHRPNPLGLTAVPLLGIEGLKLFVGTCDLIDGTPILDIKPYLTTADCFPDARMGWLEEVERELTAPPSYALSIEPLADEQLTWLAREWSINFIDRAKELLERDPGIHRTRRIRRAQGEERVMACGPWRIYFKVEGSLVSLLRITKGYPDKLLYAEGYDRIPDREAQIAFSSLWPADEI